MFPGTKSTHTIVEHGKVSKFRVPKRIKTLNKAETARMEMQLEDIRMQNERDLQIRKRQMQLKRQLMSYEEMKTERNNQRLMSLQREKQLEEERLKRQNKQKQEMYKEIKSTYERERLPII